MLHLITEIWNVSCRSPYHSNFSIPTAKESTKFLFTRQNSKSYSLLKIRPQDMVTRRLQSWLRSVSCCPDQYHYCFALVGKTFSSLRINLWRTSFSDSNFQTWNCMDLAFLLCWGQRQRFLKKMFISVASVPGIELAHNKYRWAEMNKLEYSGKYHCSL